MERSHRENETGLSWSVHILKESPEKLLLIAPLVLGSLAVAFVLSHSLFLMAVVCMLFLSSLADYLFPVRFEIDSEGAVCRTLVGRSSISWDRVKKYYLDDFGIKLSPLSKQGRLEAYRGVYLRFNGNRETVMQAVRRLRDAKCPDSGDTGRGLVS